MAVGYPGARVSSASSTPELRQPRDLQHSDHVCPRGSDREPPSHGDEVFLGHDEGGYARAVDEGDADRLGMISSGPSAMSGSRASRSLGAESMSSSPTRAMTTVPPRYATSPQTQNDSGRCSISRGFDVATSARASGLRGNRRRFKGWPDSFRPIPGYRSCEETPRRRGNDGM